MDEIKIFLQSSTIHGLNYISDSRKVVRLFWMIIVIVGFLTAGSKIETGVLGMERFP